MGGACDVGRDGETSPTWSIGPPDQVMEDAGIPPLSLVAKAKTIK